jgi:hypothetical protein
VVNRPEAHRRPAATILFAVTDDRDAVPSSHAVTAGPPGRRDPDPEE